MKRVTRNGLIAAAAASGAAMAVAMPAHADASADGGTAASPGLISGNTLQLPVHVPVNVCGNTVNVAGLLNPAAGNGCANVSEGGAPAPAGGATAGAAKALVPSHAAVLSRSGAERILRACSRATACSSRCTSR